MVLTDRGVGRRIIPLDSTNPRPYLGDTMAVHSALAPTIIAMMKNPDLNDRIASALRRHGFGVLHVDSPDAAMTAQLNATDRIHLLITDDSLDARAGDTLFHRMGLSQDRLVVLYISTEPKGQPLIEGVAQVHFLSVPFTDVELFAAVAQLLLVAPWPRCGPA